MAESTPREELVDAFESVGFETWLQRVISSGHLATESIRFQSESIEFDALYDLNVKTPTAAGLAWTGTKDLHPVIEWSDEIRNNLATLPANAVLLLNEQTKNRWPSPDLPGCRLAIVPAVHSLAPRDAELEPYIHAVDFFVRDPIGHELTRSHPAIQGCLREVQDATPHLLATAPSPTWFLIDGRSLSEAGADPTEALALILLLSTEYARQMVRGGLSWEAAPGRLGILQPIVDNPFLGIAQLRALRWTWSRFAELCGTRSIGPIILSEAMATPVEPADKPDTSGAPNPFAIFRATILSFASMLGGATHVLLPKPSSFGQDRMQNALRLSVNIDRILRSEARLNQGPDPILGCRFLESVTYDLATKAWLLFQSVENAGGIGAVGTDGVKGILRTFRNEVADGKST